jgi:hypothetical protein
MMRLTLKGVAARTASKFGVVFNVIDEQGRVVQLRDDAFDVRNDLLSEPTKMNGLQQGPSGRFAHLWDLQPLLEGVDQLASNIFAGDLFACTRAPRRHARARTGALEQLG